MRTDATHQDAALRNHRRRFRIDGVASMLKLKTALQTMEQNEEAILLALDRVGVQDAMRSALTMRTALRVLVEGPGGEF